MHGATLKNTANVPQINKSNEQETLSECVTFTARK